MSDTSPPDLKAFSARLEAAGFRALDAEALRRMHAALPALTAMLKRVHQPLTLEDEPAHLPRFLPADRPTPAAP